MTEAWHRIGRVLVVSMAMLCVVWSAVALAGEPVAEPELSALAELIHSLGLPGAVAALVGWLVRHNGVPVVVSHRLDPETLAALRGLVRPEDP